MSKVSGYQDLDVWKRSMDAAEEGLQADRGPPNDERFSLCDQMRRAAVSVPSNIAEGYGRGVTGSYVSRLRIPRGSIAELETQIELSVRLHGIAHSRVESLLTEFGELTRMLSSLIRRVEESQ